MLKTYYFLFLSFIIYSFLGWIIEVLYHIYKEKHFINRGFLYGPVCPIYGTSAVLLILSLTPFKNNYILVFIIGAIIVSILEYFTGYVLEMLFNTRWWDYSKEKFNINGYVCARFSIYWGIFSVILISIIHPNISNLIYFFNDRYGEKIYSILFALLVMDSVLTVKSLFDLKDIYKELQEILIEIKNNIEKLKLNATISTEAKLKLENKIEALTEIKERILRRLSFKHKLLIRSYPKLKSNKFEGALSQIIEKYKLK